MANNNGNPLLSNEEVEVKSNPLLSNEEVDITAQKKSQSETTTGAKEPSGADLGTQQEQQSGSGGKGEQPVEQVAPIELPKTYERTEPSTYKNLVGGQKYFLSRGGKRIVGTWDAEKGEFIKDPLLSATPQVKKEVGFLQAIEVGMTLKPPMETEEEALARVSMDTDEVKKEIATKIENVDNLTGYPLVRRYMQLNELYSQSDDPKQRDAIKKELDKLKDKNVAEEGYLGAQISTDETPVYTNAYLPSLPPYKQFEEFKGELPKIDKTVGQAASEILSDKDFIEQGVQEVNQFDGMLNQYLLDKLPQEKQLELSTIKDPEEYNTKFQEALLESKEVENVIPALFMGLSQKMDALGNLGSNLGLDDDKLAKKKLNEIRYKELFNKQPKGFAAELTSSVGGMLPDLTAGAAYAPLMLMSMMSTMPNDYLEQSIAEDYYAGRPIDIKKAKQFAAVSTAMQGGMLVGAGVVGGQGLKLVGKTRMKRAGELLYEIGKRGTKDAIIFGALGTKLQNQINKAYNVTENDDYLHSMVHMAAIGGLFAAKEGFPQLKLSTKQKSEIDYMASYLPQEYTKQQIKQLISKGLVTPTQGDAILKKLDDYRFIQNELPTTDISYEQMDKIYPLWLQKQELQKKTDNATPEMKSVLNGQITEVDRSILIEAAIPLTSMEKMELNKLQTVRDENKTYDQDRLKFLEDRQKAAEQETIKRQQEQKAAEELTAKPEAVTEGEPKTETDATKTIEQQEGVSAERKTGGEGGETREAGGGDSVQRKAEGAEEGQVAEGGVTAPTPEPVKVDRASIVSNTKSEVDRVIASEPNENGHGQTFNLDGTVHSEGGLVIPIVSENLKVSELTPERIADFVEANKDKLGGNSVKVGIYKFPNGEDASIDLNVVAPREMREQAIEFGREAGQESLWDLDIEKNIKTGSDGKNPKQFTTQEFIDIAKRFSETPTEPVAETTVPKTEVETAISNVAKALKETGVEIEQLSDQEFREITKDLDGQMSEGEGLFISSDGKIYLNSDKLSSEWGKTIVFHEGTHPIINIIRNTNKATYDAMVGGLKKAAETNQGIKEVVEWAKKEYGSQGEARVEDETIVETIARIGDGRLKLDDVPPTLRQKFIDTVNSIAKMLGFDQVLSDTDPVAFKKMAEKIATALREGQDISEIVGKENVEKYEYKINQDIQSNEGGTAVYAGKISQARIQEAKVEDVYSEKEIGDVKVIPLSDILNKHDNKAVIINSDPTKVGKIKLPSGKEIFMYGGHNYGSIKENIEGNIGFATTKIGKVTQHDNLSKKVFGENNKGLTLVATQAPTALLSNSYALRIALDAISQLPKSVRRSSEFKNELFGKNIVTLEMAMGEKKYNEFLKKFKGIDFGSQEAVDRMIADIGYNIGQSNEPINFKARGEFVANLLANIVPKSNRKQTANEAGYVSVEPNKYIAKALKSEFGLTVEKLMYDLGQKNIVDQYMNNGNWGFVVSGFETNPNIKAENVQSKGVKHPLFNAKFAGENPFVLDGLYSVDKLLPSQEITSKTGKPYTKKASIMLSTSMYVGGIEGATGKEGASIFPLQRGTQAQASKGGRGETTAKELKAETSAEKGKDYEFYEPIKGIKNVIKDIKSKFGITTPEGKRIRTVDVNKGKEIADAFEEMKSDPNNPEVKAAYKAFSDETLQQAKELLERTGIKIEMSKTGDEYANAGEMLNDIRNNNHLYVFDTESGFGDTPITDKMRREHPLLQDSGMKDINGVPMKVNDVFRWVHDAITHGERGSDFSAIGEENAWDAHSRLYSPLARRAMTTETRGQNSWTNFGKHMRNSDGTFKIAEGENIKYAPQKVGLLPEKFSKLPEEIKPKQYETETTTKEEQPVLEGVRDGGDKTKAGQESAELRPEGEEKVASSGIETPPTAETAPNQVQNFEAVLAERTDKKRDKALKAFGEQEARAKELLDNYDANVDKLKAQGIEPTGTKAEVLADMMSGKYDVTGEGKTPSKAEPTATEPQTKLQQAKKQLKDAFSAYQEASDITKLGFAAFNKDKQLKAVEDLHKALVNVAKEMINSGVDDVKKFAKQVGLSVKNVKQAWDEAMGVATFKAEELKYDLGEISKTALRQGLNIKEKLQEKLEEQKGKTQDVTKSVKAIVDFVKQYSDRGNLTRADLTKIMDIIPSVKNQKSLDAAANKILDIIDSASTDKVEVSERQALKDQIKLEVKAAREGFKAAKLEQKGFAEAVKDFLNDADIKGVVNTVQLKALVKKASSITTQKQYENFIAYAEKVIKDVNFAQDMADLQSAAKQVKKGKHGRFTQMVKEFASIDPEVLTETNLEKYKEAIDALNQKVPSYDKMAEHHNEIMTDVDAVESNYSNIQTFDQASKKFDKIQQQEVKTVEDYRTLSRNISGLKNRLNNLLADGSISQDDYTYLIEQIESKDSEIGGRLSKEIDELKTNQVKDIKATPLDRSQLTPQENAILNRLNQLSPEDLKRLSVGDLDVLSQAVKRVEQGFVPMQKVTDIVVKAEAKRDAPKVVEELNNATKADTDKAGLTRDMKLNEAAFISRIIGAKEGGAVDKYIINPVVRDITKFRKDVNTANKKWLDAKKKAFGTFTLSSTIKKSMNKLGLLFNMLQNLNGDAPMDWCILSQNQKEIDKYVSQFEASKQAGIRAEINRELNLLEGDKSKAKMIREQYNELLAKFDAGDGTIDLAKLKAAVEDGTAFTQAEKILFDAIIDIDGDLKVKQQAANEIQGKEFRAMEFHKKRIPLGRDTEVEMKVEAVKPAMRAGSGKSRVDQKPRAIETDIEKILIGSIEETNKDYYTLNATKGVNEVVKETARQGKFSNNALNAIRDNVQARINTEFAKSQTGFGSKLLAARMASSLLDVGRAAVETATAFTYTPLRAGNLKGYGTFFNPFQRSIAHKLISDTNSSLGLKRLNKQMEAGTEVNSKNMLVKIGEKIMTFPEHATLDMAWMPRFETAFKEITGEEFNSKKYETDNSYRENFNQAILDAATEADVVTKQIVGGGLKFEGRQFIRVLPKFTEKVGAKTMVDANTYPGKIAGFFGTYTARESKEFFDGFSKIYKGATKGNLGEVGKGGGKVLATAIGAVGYGVGMALYNAMWTKMTSDDKEQKEKAQAVIDQYYTWDGWTKETAAQLAFLGTSRYGAVGRGATLMAVSSAYNSAETKEEKAQIEKFAKEQLFTKPLDFSGKWGTQASNFKTIGRFEPYISFAAEKIIDAGEGVKGYWELADIVKEKGFKSLTDNEKQKFVASELFLNTINMMLMFKGTQVPMTPKIEQFIREGKKKGSSTGTSQRKIN